MHNVRMNFGQPVIEMLYAVQQWLISLSTASEITILVLTIIIAITAVVTGYYTILFYISGKRSEERSNRLDTLKTKQHVLEKALKDVNELNENFREITKSGIHEMAMRSYRKLDPGTYDGLFQKIRKRVAESDDTDKVFYNVMREIEETGVENMQPFVQSIRAAVHPLGSILVHILSYAQKEFAKDPGIKVAESIVRLSIEWKETNNDDLGNAGFVVRTAEEINAIVSEIESAFTEMTHFLHRENSKALLALAKYQENTDQGL